jgi:hypothetical protein
MRPLRRRKVVVLESQEEYRRIEILRRQVRSGSDSPRHLQIERAGVDLAGADELRAEPFQFRRNANPEAPQTGPEPLQVRGEMEEGCPLDLDYFVDRIAE